MTKSNDKAGLALPQTKLTTPQQPLLTEPLSQLEDTLHNLLASYRFYHCAIRHMTEPDHCEGSEEWHFGLFLQQQYLQRQADTVMEKLLAIKQLIKT